METYDLELDGFAVQFDGADFLKEEEGGGGHPEREGSPTQKGSCGIEGGDGDTSWGM